LDENLEKLQAALREVRDLYDNAPCGYLSQDAGGILTQINETALHWLGRRRAEVVGKPFVELLTPASRTAYENRLASLKLTGRMPDLDLDFFRKNGTILPVALSSAAIQDADRTFQGSRCTLFDITERKRAERKVEASESRLLAFLSHIPAVIFVKDLEGRYLYVNDEFLRSFELEGSQILFRSDAEIFPDGQAGMFRGNDALVLESGSAMQFEETALYADGPHTSIVSKFPIRDDNGEIVALGGIATDITDRKRTTEALKKVNRALRVLSGANEAIVQAETAQDLYVSVCNLIVESGSYVMAWIGYAEKDEEKTVRPVAHRGADDGYLTAIKVTWSDSDLGMGPTGMAVKTGQCSINHNIATNPAMGPWRAEAMARGYMSSIALPLKDETGVFGVLTIYASEPDAFDEDEVKLLKDLSFDLSFGIEAIRTRIERRKAEHAAHRLAYFDPLTDLPNRTYLRERWEQAVRDAAAKQTPATLLLVNIEHFSEIQDGLGVRQADQVLRQVAARLQGVAREHFIARLEADRFAFILAGAGSDGAEAVAARIQQIMSAPVEQADIPIDVRVYMGSAVCPVHGTDPDALLLRSSIASRRARTLGVPHALYSGETDQESPRRLALIAELRRAVQLDQLTLYYQPKIEISTGTVSGVEALVRWKHPSRGLVPPSDFIPLAEHTGLIRPLTEWVLAEGAQTIGQWAAAGRPLPVAVNVSPRNLRDPELYDKIVLMQERLGINPELMHIEITETTLMEDPSRSHEVLGRLKRLGMKTFIDDFGTGYSSLSYIASLPLYALKIDRAFIVKLREKEQLAIVYAAISLAHSLGLRVVAEGVETLEQLNDLRELGCDEVQGYYFSKPLPAAEFETWRASFESTRPSYLNGPSFF
jgi:diguanylate cyclase (GGDEF)-like protein/PAS domain S-box-containing protein